MHLAFEQDSRDLLGLPEHIVQTALLPVAYTLGTDFKSTHRPPPESITCFNEWEA
jgi:hypothetical protein